jgi:3-hydroxyacyl-[acyl-carrier-protein] dehydratase
VVRRTLPGAPGDARRADRRGDVAGIDDCRFKRVVEPGDVLTLTCEIDQVRGPIGRGKATAHVGDALAARGTLTFAVER